MAGIELGQESRGKSEFPESWTDDDIIGAIEDIANNPDSVKKGRAGRSVHTGSVNGVDIDVIIESPEKGGGIITGYPTNQPRNP